MHFGFLSNFLENSFMPMYGITLLCALWQYPKYFDTPLKYFPVLLLYTFLNELLGRLIAKYEDYSVILSELYYNNNWLIYNIYNFIFFVYFYYVFWNSITTASYKKIIYFGGISFTIMSLLNPFFQNFLTTSQLYAYIIGSVVLIVAIILYIKEYKISSKYKSIKTDLLFWISVGLLIFNLGYTPIKIIRYHNAINNLNDLPLIRGTHLMLILITYCLFIIGFIKMRRGLPK